MNGKNFSIKRVFGRKLRVMNVCCWISALLVLVVVTVQVAILGIHGIALGWRLVTDHCKATKELAKHSIVGDTKVVAASHLGNSSLAALQGLAEKQEAFLWSHDDLLVELFDNFVDDREVILLVGIRVNVNKCAEVIPTLSRIHSVKLCHTFERRFLVARGTTKLTEVGTHDECDLSQCFLSRDLESGVCASILLELKIRELYRHRSSSSVDRRFEISVSRKLWVSHMCLVPSRPVKV